ncbi:hypothetical protein [Psychrobacter immobilis]|uniref:hypothetical protein n=2 Tax=Psychrobacter immobilis TaxID=498 RepID=UPI00191AE391|nr:hypothetical protein [Psychrobacter immobilis]
MTILRLIGIFILNTIGVLVIGCTEQKDPNEPVTAYIPAEISDKVYVATFPRCNQNDANDLNKFSTKKLVLNFQAETFSGNVFGDFYCPSEDLGKVFRVEIDPLYELEGKVVTGENYFYYTFPQESLLEESSHIERFYSDSSQEMLVIDGMSNQTSPLQLIFAKYSNEKLGPFHNYYNLYTILDNDFLLQYKVRIMNDDYNKRFDLNGYDTQFAQVFKDVIAANGRILDHPEIIQGFVDNNERVIEFFKAHRQIITKIEFDKINDADHTVE